MDFEKMAQSASALLYDETGSPMPQIVETRLAEAFAAAFAAGREAMREDVHLILVNEERRSREVADSASRYIGPTDEIWAARAACAHDMLDAIRALPGKEGE